MLTLNYGEAIYETLMAGTGIGDGQNVYISGH